MRGATLERGVDKASRRHPVLSVLFLLALAVMLVYYVGTIMGFSYVNYFHIAGNIISSWIDEFLGNHEVGILIAENFILVQKVFFSILGTASVIWYVITFFTRAKYRYWFRPFVFLSFILCLVAVIAILLLVPVIAHFPLFTWIHDFLYMAIICTGIVWAEIISKIFPDAYLVMLKWLEINQYLLANLATFYVIWLLIFKYVSYYRELLIVGGDLGSRRLDPNSQIGALFEDVQKMAKKKSRRTPGVIKVFINPTDTSVNACAYGRNRVCLTQGTVELAATKPEMAKAIMAHELGHLTHMDTIALMITSVCNSFLLFVVVGPLNILGLGFKIAVERIPFAGSIISSISNGLESGIKKMVKTVFSVSIKIANVLGGRRDENNADLFAAKCGYGDGLVELFETIGSNSGGGFDPHPRSEQRVRNIRSYMEKYMTQNKPDAL